MTGGLLGWLAARVDRAQGPWSYRVRPYDMIADRRRWWRQERAPCQRGGIVCRADSCPECGAAVLALASETPVSCCNDHEPRAW